MKCRFLFPVVRPLGMSILSKAIDEKDETCFTRVGYSHL